MKRTTGRTFVGAALLLFPLLAAQGAAARQLTISEAVGLAIANHPDLQAAMKRLSSAELSVEGAKAAFQPEVSASVSSSGRLSAGNGDTLSTGFDGGVSLRWSLYDGGSRKSDLAQTGLERDAASIRVALQKEAVAVEAIERFLDAATATELVAVREEGLTSNRQQLDKVRAQFEAGARSITDLYSQEAEVERASSSLIAARGSLTKALLALAETTGIAGDAATIVPAGGGKLDADRLIPAGSADDLVARALASRPDLLAQKAALAAAGEAVAGARTGASPSVSFSASTGTGYSTAADGGLFSQLGDGFDASVGVSLSIPLWDRHATSLAVAKAENALEIERLTLTSLERQAALEVGTALAQCRTAAAQVESAVKQVESAAKALEAAEARYEAGVSTLVEVAQVRTLLLEARQSLVEARYNRLAQAVALAQASGGLEKALSALAGTEGRR